MAAPEGYTELGRIGFVDKGNYASGTTYRTGDVVYYNGSTWVALKDNLRGVTPAPGANWKYMARGFAAEALSAITAVDTSGVLGEAGASVTSQELIDAIADKVMTKLIEKSKIVNNLLATDATTVLSGPMGKSLDDKITQLNSDLGVLAIKQRWLSLGSGITELYGDSSYHPYAILLTDNFVYISGNFVVPADITATTTILSNLVSPVKMRWVPIYNMTTRTMYYAYIATGGTTLTIDNLPKGNYSINFGYQHAYGAGI